MFWTIVAALAFFFIGIPIIISIVGSGFEIFVGLTTSFFRLFSNKNDTNIYTSGKVEKNRTIKENINDNLSDTKTDSISNNSKVNRLQLIVIVIIGLVLIFAALCTKI
jgi:hypothetical protein